MANRDEAGNANPLAPNGDVTNALGQGEPLTWKPDENFAEDVFTFTPPEDAKKIEMVGGESAAPQPSPGP